MDTTELYSKITTNIITIQQLHQSLDHLRQTKDMLYKKDINSQEVIEKSLPYFLGEAILEMANGKQIAFTDITSIQNLIQEIETYLEKLTVAELEIAYIPTYRHIQEISAWWSKYAGKHVVLAIKVDETLITGAKVSYEGIYKDYSLGTWIKQNPLSNIEQLN